VRTLSAIRREVGMKTTKKWSKRLMVGLLAMVLALGMVVVGCNSGDTGA
jgi:hypothetical protein